MLIPKSNTYRKARWLVAVRAIRECVNCESTRDIEAAHRNYGKGFGMKTDDCLTACLCQKCHFNIDNGYDMSLSERREEMDQAILKTYLAMSSKGYITVDDSIYIPQVDEVDTSFAEVVEELCQFVKDGLINPVTVR